VAIDPKVTQCVSAQKTAARVKARRALGEQFHAEAKRQFHDEGHIEIDDYRQDSVSMAGNGERVTGAYVKAWVWVRASDLPVKDK